MATSFTSLSEISEKVTHAELLRRGIRWLTNHEHCGVTLSEIKTTATMEIPDIMGWKGSTSYMIEVKISRADFHANKQKGHVRTQCGVGQFRYFLCPARLILESDLVTPYEHHGLLWAYPDTRSVRVRKNAVRYQTCNRDAEMAMLVSALRRMRTREFLTLVPFGDDEMDGKESEE